MPLDALIQSLLTAPLPAGGRWFLVAAVPIDEPSSLIPEGSANASGTKGPERDEKNKALNYEESAKIERLVQAIQKVELNDTRKVVLKLLLTTAEGEWLSFPSMIAAIEEAGVDQAAAPGRAQAALRDISWQLKSYMNPEDLAGCTVAIDVLATRRRLGKETRYRLTHLGRAALSELFQKTP